MLTKNWELSSVLWVFWRVDFRLTICTRVVCSTEATGYFPTTKIRRLPGESDKRLDSGSIAQVKLFICRLEHPRQANVRYDSSKSQRGRSRSRLMVAVIDCPIYNHIEIMGSK